MKPEFPLILSSYDPDTDYDLLERLKHPGWTRWNKGVEMRQSGLPVQDTMLIDPNDSDDALTESIREFVRRWKSSGNSKTMTIRLDSTDSNLIPSPSHESKPDDYDLVKEHIKKRIREGFIPSLWALADFRANYLCTASIMFESPDRIVIEILGPGFDPAAISHGVIIPPITITMKPYAPSLLEFRDDMSHLPFYLDIRDEAKAFADDPERLARIRAERNDMWIKFIASLNKISPSEQTAQLKRDGYTMLFDYKAKCDFAEIEKLFRTAITYAEYKRVHGQPFRHDTIAASLTKNGKWFFNNAWDMDKYGKI
ncbi:MAG: hypothetical protein FWC51_00560 [Proteobacteria bacterium]|nr:hypothetical protein [Pseudomonadota bacterium]